MELWIIVLSEISQTEKNMFFLTCGIYTQRQRLFRDEYQEEGKGERKW
jgi:hypothetical protein